MCKYVCGNIKAKMYIYKLIHMKLCMYIYIYTPFYKHVCCHPDVGPRLNSGVPELYYPNQHICQRGCRILIPYKLM